VAEGIAGKVILVTGGCGDIGRATAAALVAEGATVVASDLYPPDEARVRLGGWGDASGIAHYVRADVRERPEVDAAIADIVARFGRLDIAISNAGVGRGIPFLDITPEQWAYHIDSNLTGCFHVGQAAARQMVAQGRGGLILFTGTWVQEIPWPEIAAYCASKGGLLMLMRCMARELAPHRIRANIVAPGIVKAGLAGWQYEHEPQYRERVGKVIPLGEMGTPQQVAQAFVYLCSSAADYMTGSSLLIDGGCSLFRFD
jgi:NAD(P)-dependent dehydrogenase (short-subunit alcohol dehydrogenase family)